MKYLNGKKIVTKPKPVEAPKPDPVVEKPKVIKQSDLFGKNKKLVTKRPNVPKVEPVAEPTPVVEEPLVEEPVVETPVEEKPQPNIMVFTPISRKKTHYEDPEPVNNSKGEAVYALDQKSFNSLIENIAAALSEKFVTRDEVQDVIEHTLQKMIVANNINDPKPAVINSAKDMIKPRKK